MADRSKEGGEDPFADTPGLFYAYARRTDNYWASRYLLTFASAAICKQWWSLVQSEYPSQGVRHGPQFFSFQGDNFLSKISSNKKFEDLNTQWLYTQFGDATGTGGRAQDVIPIQGWDGESLENPSGSKSQKVDKGKRREHADDTNSSHQVNGGESESSAQNVKALLEGLQNMQHIIESNNAQIAQLAENQSQNDDRMDRIEHVVESTASQLHYMAKAHNDVQEQNRELLEQNAKLLREIKRQRAATSSSSNNAGVSSSPGPAPAAQSPQQQPQQQQGPVPGAEQLTDADGVPCSHNVHPPPRKLDMPLVGYAYDRKPPKLDKVKKEASTPTRRTQNNKQS